MSEETFSYLCAKLCPAMEKQNTNFRACLPLRKRVAIALWKLATNSEYRSIGRLFGVSKSSVWRYVQDFCKAVGSLLAPKINFLDREKLKDMADYFENRWGLPQCVGAIDGSHIPIIAPQEYHTNYFNRKDWHSIILQGVVDGKDCSGMCYSKKTSRARVGVENAFKRHKGRWWCLMKRNDSDFKLAKSMVLACCALHNLCESHGEDFHQDWNTSSDEPVTSNSSTGYRRRVQ
ncbi:uncharacterized protein LOC143984121 [Lithobates pipiens]